MDHKKVYESLVTRARNDNRVKTDRENEDYTYYENHHILPKCLDGSDDEENLVLLTAREHFIAHKLLTYIYKGNRKIICAFHLMTFMNKRKYGITSRDYAYARELFSSTPRSQKGELNSMYGKKHSPESIEKNRKSNLGTYEERYGNEKANEMKRKLSEKGSGENNPMAGKSIYDAWMAKGGVEYADKRLEEYKANKRNKIRIRNLETNKVKVISKDESIPDGWVEGANKRTIFIPCTEEAKHKISIANKGKIRSEETRKKLSDSLKDRTFIFNVETKECKCIKFDDVDEYLNNGWEKGIIKKTKPIIGNTLWIHNDTLEKNTKLKKTDIMPKGWEIGMKRYKNKNLKT